MRKYPAVSATFPPPPLAVRFTGSPRMKGPAMTGYPTRPEDDWYPVPLLRPEDPLHGDLSAHPDDDRHLFGPAGDGCAALLAMGAVTAMVATLAVHIVLAVFN